MAKDRGVRAARLTPDLLVGRDRDLRELMRLVGSARLVTLAGPAGVGKSRLARELAGRARPNVSGGVHVAELAAVEDPALVAGVVATALPAPGRSGVTELETVLLVVENCEHVLGACAEVFASLLFTWPGLMILATSQSAVGVRGEQVWPVPPLGLCKPGAQADEVAASASVWLFCARAAAVRPGFAATPDSLGDIATICRRLDGIPLAIEMAAAQVRDLNPAVIAARLDDPFTFLVDESGSRPARHRTLRAAIDRSYDLLSSGERRLLRRLSVFEGSCSLDAVESVCGTGSDGHEVVALLAGLVRRSMVTADTAGAQARYSLLNTVRIYAAGLLMDEGAQAATRGRHLAWCCALAERAEHELSGTELVSVLDRLDEEHGNLRAALAWAESEVLAEPAMRLAGALTLFWSVRGHAHEGRQWLERALALDRSVPPPVRVKALWGAEFLASMLGVGNMAPAPLEEALALSRQSGERGLEARILTLTARRAAPASAVPAALGRAEELARAADDVWTLTHVLAQVARVLWRSGDVRTARDHLDTAISVAREAGDLLSLLPALLDKGILSLVVGELDGAQTLLSDAEDIAERLGDARSSAMALESLAECSYIRGAYQHATARLDTALTRARAAGSPMQVIGILCAEGRHHLGQGRTSEARELFGKAVNLAQEVGVATVHGNLGLGGVAVAESDWPEGRRHLDQALADADAGGEGVAALPLIVGLQAALARGEGDDQRALSCYRRAADLWNEFGPVRGVAESLEGVAGILRERGTLDNAARLLGAAQSLRDQRGYVRPPALSAAFEANVAAIRAGLGARVFRAAWEEGSRLTPSDAVAYATRGGGPRAEGDTGWTSLTRTELEIASLVAEGLTNREIGERLFNSPRTVETHITHALSKLGMRSRRELGREAERRRLGLSG